jgi:hypothetical protein
VWACRWVTRTTVAPGPLSRSSRGRPLVHKPRAAAAAAFVTAAGLLISPAAARAGPAVVSPGDEIDFTKPDGGGAFCTLGYTYTGNGHAYAITAGHCRAHGVIRADSTAAGTMLRAMVDPPHSGGADYGLIDFGTRAVALPYIGSHPVADLHPRPRLGQPICHTGAASGQHCGHVTDTYGPDQYVTYVTDDMARSIPGDSGGPVWTLRNDGGAEVIGIWVGGIVTGSGRDLGRFAALSAALADLT